VTGSFFRLALSERRFGRLVVVLVSLGFLALLAAGITAGAVMTRNQERAFWVSHTYEVERDVNAFRIQLDRLETARRGYLLDQEPVFLRTYADAVARIPGNLEQLRRLTSDNPSQQVRIAILRADAAALQSKLGASLADATAGRRDKAVHEFRTDGSVPLARRIRETTAAMLAEENRLLNIRIPDQARTARMFFAVLAVCGVLLLAVATATILVILRYTRELLVSRDGLRSLNENLEQAVEVRTVDLRRANEEIQRFAYIVSHDLRSPLVNVLGFTAELDAAAGLINALIDRAESETPEIVTEDARRAIREDIPEAIGFIRGSTQKMDRLINAILRLSREGRRTIRPERLDMDELARGVADSLRSQVDEIGAEIAIFTPLPDLTSDRLAVEQILSNLSENAVKYLAHDRPGRIIIRGSVSPGRVIYEVADNGRGIDPKDHERIFDLFRRSGAQDRPGEGIGLAHVRALAYRLGGTISCESALGQGATFRLSLPSVHVGEPSP
jgi:signal transduction histidine kinase